MIALSMTINDANGNVLGLITNPLAIEIIDPIGLVQGSISNPILVTQAPKSPLQTMKTFTGVQATQAAATTIVNLGYTVSPGKTFYLTDVVICNNSSNASQVSVNASLTSGASPMLIGHSINTSPLEAMNIGTEPSAVAGSQLSVQLGQSGTITSCTYFVAGYEQ